MSMSIVVNLEMLGSGRFELLSVHTVTTGTIKKILEAL